MARCWPGCYALVFPVISVTFSHLLDPDSIIGSMHGSLRVLDCIYTG